ncbi:cation transporter [Candidatus Pseudothioglobus singularis]|jgi:cation diffusion facilitator family transporter|uniref:cation diffusion facilitator family transporter n=1 Tax=Candidatus Pseudothioglobus singularis TaxID=1427364 RepID=UPI00014DA856|nr:cation diffusion facilitator family transporter [Candidatus Pseudothioglobus singularis]MDG1344997.1 cation diffusion facilitator family transporter [Candidatus Thioglobus sp.]ANQ66289.1 cation transporter [Candidatus Pseudothioglobus singularis]MDA7441599.1 cation diffusion facilitator family transporter [Candidatus Pseudothioglobus singularis]MDC0963934.1 cation diffusion facilitator family transporter [Candidatus Pseudothioglobus singularis]MDC3262129.1 cation diffusion facilitator famil|tara:strand:- start:1999 stop:3135 length:1137 start_codon:yes stop_codon:yes gene_type:complete
MQSNNRTKASQKVTIVGALIDFLLSIIKIILGFIGQSGALIADGVHSFSDLLTDWVTWYAAKLSGDAPDADHPYGHERFETVATLGLSIFLAIVGTIIIFEGFGRFSNPNELRHENWLIAAAALSVLSKEALYWYTVKVARDINSDLLKANAWHHRTDAFSSIVVVIGIIGAANGYFFLDSVAAIIVGILIIYIGWQLGFEATKELVDTSIDQEDIKALRVALSEIKGVNSVHTLRTRKVGHKKSADVHVQVNPFLSVSEGHIISVSVERVAKECIEELDDVTVHIDPENDEEKEDAPYKDLPERAQALKIISQSLKLENVNYNIEKTQLHYLEGEILVDFFLSADYLKNQELNNIKSELSAALEKLPDFGEVKVYFS